MSIVLFISSVLSPIGADDSFFKSNLDAQAIISENQISTEQELYDYVIDYLENSPVPCSTSGKDVSDAIMNTQDYLKNNYGDVSWFTSSKRQTSDVSGAIPLNMKGPEFPNRIFDEAVDRSGIKSSYGGCGSIAMVGILDYFARYLNYKTIMADPYNDEDMIRLVTDVFSETTQWNLGENTLVFPGDYKNSCNTLLKRYGLEDVISCDYTGTLLFGGIKDKLIEIIVDKIDEGLPVTMYTGLMSGNGDFSQHYTNIYGYEKYIGFDNEGNRIVKYLLEARLNWSGYNDTYYCDDDILDTGMMGIIYYNVNYKNEHSIVASDFASTFINDAGQGQYFYYNKNATVTTSAGYTFNTSRLRCSYIENQYLVLSTKRKDVVDAYLELNLSNEVHRLTFTSALWSSKEGMGTSDVFAIQILKDGIWQNYVEYDVSNMSKDKSNPDLHVVLLPKGTTNIRFYAKHSSPSGDQNRGRIVLDKINVQYN